MRLSKFLLTLAVLTSFSLLYVYQQTEIFRLAYIGQKKHANFQDLLDKNNILRYNIRSGASLVSIGNKISASCDYEMPDTYRLVRLLPSKGNTRLVESTQNKETLLSRIFGIGRQAEARTVNP